jgi:NADP-dependent 3-hydroxy acid dehydrogenase YdfG
LVRPASEKDFVAPVSTKMRQARNCNEGDRPMGKLSGKVAWITGAGTGIGLAAAKALAQSGATVVMSGRREGVLASEAAQIRAGAGKAELAVLDVADSAAAARVAEGILARHGRIDILVNSAGVNTANRFWKNQTAQGWREVVGINLDGTFYTTQAVLPAMRARADGVIINVSSWAGVFHPRMTGPAYNGSKHAVTAMTETINMEEGVNGIRACTICPAEVATPILDSRPVPPSAEQRAKMLQPQDLGDVIRYVAELPPHACINQLIISPTWNRIYIENL